MKTAGLMFLGWVIGNALIVIGYVVVVKTMDSAFNHPNRKR